VLGTVSHLITSLANGIPIDYPSVFIGLSSGFGLIFARDNKVTSEDVGAK
jgi:hypothetical protein